MEEIGEISGVGGWTLDLETSDVRWSTQTRRIHEVPMDYQPTLESAIEFYAPEAREAVLNYVNKAIETGEGWDFNLPLITARGRRIWVRAVGRPFFKDGKAIRVVGSFQDTTLQTARELELKAARDAAESASRAKSSFLANISHEIRTPMNGIVGLIDALSSQELTSKQERLVDAIRTSSDTLQRLLTDVLETTRIEAGKLELVEQEFDLEKVIHAVAYSHNTNAQSKSLALETTVDTSAHGLWFGDSIRFSQVISNILDNAIKFTEQGAVSIHVYALKTSEDTESLRVSIKDTGIGFDEATGKRIFQKFEQGDQSTTRAFGGVGLGLNICQSIAFQMGGTITVTSTPHVGSEFVFEAPMRRMATSEAAA